MDEWINIKTGSVCKEVGILHHHIQTAARDVDLLKVYDSTQITQLKQTQTNKQNINLSQSL